ncbi:MULTISPECIES: ABC transporter substrate-binding protein [Streptomyces]|uniref:ABC transporter substrate-binding protein n=1 Tax=Streptomyces TaxID=1883 RepID=UPI00167A7082|nr:MULTISPECIES: ABC transporter substrate-binding protein [Streptomyces]MBD3580800.1 ABC transporter substrate-binding protein [Streptomyces sp. KD18]GGS85588.1 ABC transporter substrate-binding protein [Streptomyces toxytricini]
MHADDPVFRMGITEPTAIDPYKAQEGEGILVCKLLFTGLLALDGDGAPAPATAVAWEGNADATTWTFTLRPDTVFSNGEPVTAHSFVRGWSRALDPAAATETAYHLAGVRSFTAADDTTLVVELSEPDVEFDLKTLQPVFSPVPECAGPALDPAYNDMPIGNGPFKMAGPWEHHRAIRLVRNDRWNLGPAPEVREVHIDVLDPVTGLDDEYARFLDGTYDYARIPPARTAEAAARDGFTEQEGAGLFYLIPFCHRAPMDSLDARRALSAAIDRQGLVDRHFHGRRTPAHSLLSPWFGKAHTPRGTADADWTAFDPDRARSAALRAGLGPGSSVQFAYNTGAGHDAWVADLARGLEEVLGWRVELLRTDARGLVDHRTSIGAAGFCRAGWACDYPTPDNVLYPLLHSSCTAPDAAGTAHGDNEGRYANPEFDALVARARGCADPAGRAGFWRRAEAVAMADLALVPLWYRTDQRVYAADRITGLRIDFDGNPTLTTVKARKTTR